MSPCSSLSDAQIALDSLCASSESLGLPVPRVSYQWGGLATSSPTTTVVSDSPGVRTPLQHGSHYAHRSSRKELWHSESTRADQEALGQDINVLPFFSSTDCLEPQWLHIASLRQSASPSNLEPGCIPGIYGQLSASHVTFTFVSLPHSLFSSFLLSWDCIPQWSAAQKLGHTSCFLEQYFSNINVHTNHLSVWLIFWFWVGTEMLHSALAQGDTSMVSLRPTPPVTRF